MAIENPVFLKIQSAISPIVSIGVGSAICTVCNRHDLDPTCLEIKDISTIKGELLEHYKKFWEKQISEIEVALNNLG